MHIIPVIDIKNGLVVHARQGMREAYKPIKSPLCPSADIFEVMKRFLSLYRFSIFYIADLDAITRQGNNETLIAHLLQAYPGTVFWVDSGYPLRNHPLRNFKNYLPVLGSESFQDEVTDDILGFHRRFVLSLDYTKSGQTGAASLFSQQTLWPEHIIIMTLPRVGSNLGPDKALLSDYCRQFPEKKFIAAGGIRHSQDLTALKTIGVHHALVATALHNGGISGNDILHLQTKKYPA